ncbi:MAG: nicotinate-nicotinamide nucleotide adenylyltransferase [Alphaproteobacteria bacterium]|nr:nicotinate-nicotinamide nucleotide adenylyltransferase [Alphaproteobacteria bacterium]
MVIAVYGGSFNPPHVGHAMVSAWLLWTRQVDAVWLLPAYKHAFDKALAPFERRCAMLEATLPSLPSGISVCRVEAELPTPSYTWNTLVALRARHPEARFRLVIGADNLDVVDKWHRWPDIAAEFDPIVVGRAGFPPVEGAPTFPAVSSTEIRERVKRGQPVDHLVLADVRPLLEGAWGQP